MKTHEELKVEALHAIRSKGHMHEGELLQLLFPAPQFPGSTAGEPALEAWRSDQAEYITKAYVGNGIEYRDSYASKVSKATIELTKEGKINEHNNGYASYSFTPRT